MGAEEAGEVLNCGPQTVHAWAHAGRLDDALVRGGGKGDVFLFDRECLVQFAAGRVTGPEAARLLGVDVKTVNNWVARGLLAPLGDPTAKGRRYCVAPDGSGPSHDQVMATTCPVSPQKVGVSLRRLRLKAMYTVRPRRTSPRAIAYGAE